MSERRRYKNPPIIEALCEFQFKPGQEWDLTIPGKVHTALEDEYSSKPQKEIAEEEMLEPEEDSSYLVHGGKFDRVQLFTPDGKRLIGIGRDTLSIHILHPYQDVEQPNRSGWEEFQSRIETALDAYWQVAGPAGVCRIDIRYINDIKIPQGEENIEDYVKSSPPTVEGLSNRRAFVSQIHYDYENDIRLVLSQGSIGRKSNLGVLLDLDVIWETSESVTQGEALEKVNHLRDVEREIFESIITDRSREIFDAS